MESRKEFPLCKIQGIVLVLLVLIIFILLSESNAFVDNTKKAMVDSAKMSYLIGCKEAGGIDCDELAKKYITPMKEILHEN